MSDWYQVNEVFTSVQGEGILVGTPATFIRLQGCPVGCVWCDSGPIADDPEFKRRTNGKTTNTWGKGGMRMTIAEIMAKVNRRHVIITGGEPMIWNLDPLIQALRAAGHFIQIETSGLKDPIGKEIPDHVTISPKENLKYIIPEFLLALAAEVKWVVDDNLTYETIRDTFMKENSHTAVFVLMPEGCPPSPAHIEKTFQFLDRWSEEQPGSSDWIFGDRLQYRLGVR